MEKRLLLAVVLSIVVMLLYPLFIGKVISPPAGFEETPSRLVEKRDVVGTHTETMEREATEVSEPMLPKGAISGAFTNRTYELGISNIGGSIQKIRIKDGKRLDIDLVEGAIYQAGILSIEGKGALAGLSSQPFEIKEDTATLYAEKSGIAVEKNIRFLRDKHALTASIKITNNSGVTQALSFEITTGSNISNKEIYESRFISADVLYEDGKFKRIAGGNFKKYNRLYQNNIKWLALKNIIGRLEKTNSGFVGIVFRSFY